MHPGLAGPIVIAGFRSAPDVAHVDTALTGQLVERREDVDELMMVFDGAGSGAALPSVGRADQRGGEFVDLTDASWRMSSYSNNGVLTCVEVAAGLPGRDVAVRDSKDRRGPVLIVSADEWTAFTAAIRCGEFDLA